VNELPGRLPDLPCLCASIRRASRTLTQIYDEALRPLGLRATQFTVLQALSLAGEVLQGDLGQMLAIDSTTLTRTLEILSRHGWIDKRSGEDLRERRIRLSKAGQLQFEKAVPLWEKAQAGIRRKLGDGPWNTLLKFTNDVTNLIKE
jgi:DNA-binding MarR family transcriptional regulator